LTARSARAAGCAIIAAVDDAKAPVARDAGLVLRHSTASPGFFPSLTACVSLLQALAGLLYVRSGHDSRVALRRTEARIQAHAAYGASRQPDS
jgi:DNA-binding MurR/RpiR family transcriptional regulator